MNYRSIKQTLFVDPEFESLSPLAQYLLVMLRLRSTNIIALYRPDWDSIRGLLKVNDKQLRSLLDELRLKPWVVEERGFVWVVNGFRYELGEKKGGIPNQPNESHSNAVGNALSSLPTLHIATWFANYYNDKGFGEKFDTAIANYIDPDDTLPTPPAHRRHQSGSVSGSGSESGSDTDSDTLASAKPPHRVERQRSPKQQILDAPLQAFADTYKRVYGKDYMFVSGRDHKTIQRLMGKTSPEAFLLDFKERLAVAAERHAPGDQWNEFPTDLSLFAARWNKLVVARPGPAANPEQEAKQAAYRERYLKEHGYGG